MLKKNLFGVCVVLMLMIQVGLAGAEVLKLQFLSPDVAKRMDSLRWDMPKLKAWRRQPLKTVNDGLDGMFELKVKILNVPNELVNITPRLKICPIPNSIDKCWEQEVLTPINKKGEFDCRVYFRLSNWDTHLLKFKFGSRIVKVSINERPF